MKKIRLKIAGMWFTIPVPWMFTRWVVFPYFRKTPKADNSNNRYI